MLKFFNILLVITVITVMLTMANASAALCTSSECNNVPGCAGATLTYPSPTDTTHPGGQGGGFNPVGCRTTGAFSEVTSPYVAWTCLQCQTGYRPKAQVLKFINSVVVNYCGHTTECEIIPPNEPNLGYGTTCYKSSCNQICNGNALIGYIEPGKTSGGVTCPSDVMTRLPGCKRGGCVPGLTMQTCGECDTGYVPYGGDRLFVGNVGIPAVPSCAIQYNCIQCTDTCASGCTFANGVGTATGTTCNNGPACSCTLAYCDSGYYKSSATTCTRCPSIPADWTARGGYISSRNGGTNGITDCFASGDFSDATGNFTLTDACYWTP